MKLLRTSRGLTVLFRHADSNVVNFRYVITCGALDEQVPAEYGTCHALEHMLFAGTKKRTWLEIVRAWDKLGARFNAFTQPNKTFYDVTVLNKNWKEAYEVLADVLYNPTFPEDRWEEVEKGAVISEIQGDEDDEEFRFGQQLFENALGGNFHSICGKEATVRQITVDALEKFYEQHYCGQNVILLVSGDISETQLLRTVERHDKLRDDLPKARGKFNYDFNYSPFRFGADVSQIIMGRLKPVPRSRSLRNQAALRLGNKCLSQYLFEELREKRGLCYGVQAGLWWEIPDNLLLGITTGTDRERGAKTNKVLNTSLHNFIEAGLTYERIENTRSKEALFITEASETPDDATEWMWSAWEDHIYTDPFAAYLGILKAIDAGTVRRVMRKALSGNIKTAIMAPGDFRWS